MIATGVSDPGDDDDDDLEKVKYLLERAMKRLEERMGPSDAYETDTHAWAFEQARRLRAGEPIDTENIAEELEDLGRQLQDQLFVHLDLLLTHLLKCEFQPSKHTRSWDVTIKEQRRRVSRLLAKMPSLKKKLGEAIADAYPIAVLHASRETEIVDTDFPRKCPYSVEQILTGEAE